MAVIGDITRMERWKDMEYIIIIVEKNTWGNTCKVTYTGMEYTDGQLQKYIMGYRNRIK